MCFFDSPAKYPFWDPRSEPLRVWRTQLFSGTPRDRAAQSDLALYRRHVSPASQMDICNDSGLRQFLRVLETLVSELVALGDDDQRRRKVVEPGPK